MMVRHPVLMAVLAATTLAPCSAGPTTPEVAQDPVAIQFANLVNAVRVEAGCSELKWHDGAADVAGRHSRDMRDRRFFSHENPDGLNPFDRLEAAGIKYAAAAENILHGEATATRALGLWMDSEGHRANILDCSFTHHGVGRADSHWTHLFLKDPA
jgi:uncharacterized protein YkwD